MQTEDINYFFALPRKGNASISALVLLCHKSSGTNPTKELYRHIQNGRIYYQRHKTGKELNSPILPQTRDILERYSKSDASPDDYIFPILDRHIHKNEQQICNRVHKVIGHVNANLKRIAEMAGLHSRPMLHGIHLQPYWKGLE